MAIDTKNERLALLDLWNDPDGTVDKDARLALLDLWLTPATVSTLEELIIAKMCELIEGMTTTGGYIHDWGMCNQNDIAKMDKFPNAQVFMLSEENQDPIDGAHAQSYTNQMIIRIKTYSKLTGVALVPNYEINVNHVRALHDLKRLFGINCQIDGKANAILYRSSNFEIERAGDVHIPGFMTSDWLVTYVQDRLEPINHAN